MLRFCLECDRENVHQPALTGTQDTQHQRDLSPAQALSFQTLMPSHGKRFSRTTRSSSSSSSIRRRSSSTHIGLPEIVPSLGESSKPRGSGGSTVNLRLLPWTDFTLLASTSGAFFPSPPPPPGPSAMAPVRPSLKSSSFVASSMRGYIAMGNE